MERRFSILTLGVSVRGFPTDERAMGEGGRSSMTVGIIVQETDEQTEQTWKEKEKETETQGRERQR